MPTNSNTSASLCITRVSSRSARASPPSITVEKPDPYGCQRHPIVLAFDAMNAFSSAGPVRQTR